MNEVFIATVRYSDNLGDGVIGDCVEYALKENLCHASIRHFDIAGRTEFIAEAEPALERRIFDRCPDALKPALVLGHWLLRGRAKVRSAWAGLNPKIGGVLIFGGGQLLSDQALNFPLKFREVCRLAARRKFVIAISGLGVGASWSWLGRHLFKDGLLNKSVSYISLRDPQSFDRLKAFVPERGADIRLTFDPAVLVDEVYGLTADPTSQLAGVGVSSPAEIERYLEAGEKSHASPFIFWEDVVLGILAQGWTPVIFTNGASYDESFKQEFVDFFRKRHPEASIDVASRPTTPRELVSLLARFGAVVSHRLHANIICYSLGVHSVGISWDKKLRSFFDTANRGDYCLDSDATPSDVVARLFLGVQPIDQSHKSNLKSLVRLRVRELCQIIGDRRK